MGKAFRGLLGRVWTRVALVLSDPRGINTVELFMILGVVTIILGATLFVFKTPVTNWWNAKILPQFPTS